EINGKFCDCRVSSPLLTRGGRFRGVLLKSHSPPRITARRGGCVTKKMLRGILIDAAGLVFLIRTIGKPPRPLLRLRAGASQIKADASRYFLDRSDAPCGDARRRNNRCVEGMASEKGCHPWQSFCQN